jgi:S-adenosylmethionine:tRNA ribosyltransferase-isomerase
MLPVAAFDYDLPPDLIAQEPRPRGTSRLLVLDRALSRWTESSIAHLPSLLTPGDLVVANDTRVFPARLLGRRDPSGGSAECLLLEPADDATWWALVHPGQKLRPGTRLVFEDALRAPGVSLRAHVLEQRFFGRRRVALQQSGAESVADAIERLGHVPLPPYIRRPDREDDRERYQTVYARASRSVAAPTAGLHFDAALIDGLIAAGLQWTTVTLHVGYGTFKPVRAEHVEDHRVDGERYEIAPAAAQAIQTARAAGRRVVAIGTTTTRALESAAARTGIVEAGPGVTELFIRPGHRFQVVDALLTNFHLPRSSLLMLVAAFAGVDLTLSAYREAVTRRFRFYSYGDAMLIR